MSYDVGKEPTSIGVDIGEDSILLVLSCLYPILTV